MPPQQISPSAAQPLAVVLGHDAGLAERVGDLGHVPLGIFGPGVHADARVDPHVAVRPHAQLAELAGHVARLVDLADEGLPLVVRSDRRAAAGAAVDRRDDRADDRLRARAFSARRVGLLIAAVDVEVGMVEEDVEALELHAVDLGRGRHVEHGVQIDGRLGALALAHQSRPGGVVELGEVVRVFVGHRSVLGLGSRFVWVVLKAVTDAPLTRSPA